MTDTKEFLFQIRRFSFRLQVNHDINLVKLLITNGFDFSILYPSSTYTLLLHTIKDGE